MAFYVPLIPQMMVRIFFHIHIHMMILHLDPLMLLLSSFPHLVLHHTVCLLHMMLVPPFRPHAGMIVPLTSDSDTILNQFAYSDAL